MNDPEILGVRYGTVETTRRGIFYRYEEYGEPDAVERMDYYLWLVRASSDSDYILFDTGFDAEDGRRRGRHCLVDPLDAISRLGIAPEAISRIVVSHCHYDHIGNLSRFPEATIVIQKRELEFWRSPTARHEQFSSLTNWGQFEHLLEAHGDGRVHVVDGDVELEPGVHTMLLGGHCPGSQALVVSFPVGDVVLAADAIHFYRELTNDWPFAILSDLAESYETLERLRSLQRDGALVVAGHDPQDIDTFPAVEGFEGLAFRLGGAALDPRTAPTMKGTSHVH